MSSDVNKRDLLIFFWRLKNTLKIIFAMSFICLIYLLINISNSFVWVRLLNISKKLRNDSKKLLDGFSDCFFYRNLTSLLNWNFRYRLQQCLLTLHDNRLKLIFCVPISNSMSKLITKIFFFSLFSGFRLAVRNLWHPR